MGLRFTGTRVLCNFTVSFARRGSRQPELLYGGESELIKTRPSGENVSSGRP